MKSKFIVVLGIITVLLAMSFGSVFAEMDWEKRAGTAQYKGADWNNEVRRAEGISVEEAKRIAERDPDIDYFFIVTGYSLYLGDKGVFRNGDAVFFSGEPWLASAPGTADTYVWHGGSAAGGGSGAAGRGGSGSSYGDVVHLNDEEFYKEVSGQLVFVDFYADWCGPCVAFGPVFEEAASIHSDTMFVKMDVDENGVVPGDFGVQYIPYIAAVYDGEEVDKYNGNRTIDAFSDWCASYIEDYAGY